MGALGPITGVTGREALHANDILKCVSTPFQTVIFVMWSDRKTKCNHGYNQGCLGFMMLALKSKV